MSFGVMRGGIVIRARVCRGPSRGRWYVGGHDNRREAGIGYPLEEVITLILVARRVQLEPAATIGDRTDLLCEAGADR